MWSNVTPKQRYGAFTFFSGGRWSVRHLLADGCLVSNGHGQRRI